MIHSLGPNKCPVSCRCSANVEFEFWYLRDWRCSLYHLWNDLPFCLVHFFPQSGYVNGQIPLLLNSLISLLLLYAKIFFYSVISSICYFGISTSKWYVNEFYFFPTVCKSNPFFLGLTQCSRDTLQFAKKGKLINFLKKIYIYSETIRNNQINEESTTGSNKHVFWHIHLHSHTPTHHKQ